MSRLSLVKLEAGLVSLGIAVVPAVVVLGLELERPPCLGLLDTEVGVLLALLFPVAAPPVLPPAEAAASLDCATCCRHLARRFLNQT